MCARTRVCTSVEDGSQLLTHSSAGAHARRGYARARVEASRPSVVRMARMARAQRTRTRQRARMGQVVLEAPPQMGPSSRTCATERNPRARARGLAWTATVTARIAARHSYFKLAHCRSQGLPASLARKHARSPRGTASARERLCGRAPSSPPALASLDARAPRHRASGCSSSAARSPLASPLAAPCSAHAPVPQHAAHTKCTIPWSK